MKKSYVFLAGAGLILAGFFPSLGGSEILFRRQPAVVVPFITEAPKIDGDLSDAAWKNVPEVPMYLSGKTAFESGRKQALYPTKLKLANDGNYLYCSVSAVNPAAPGGSPGANCWDRDGFEIVLNNGVRNPVNSSQVIFLDRFGQWEIAPRGEERIELTLKDIKGKTIQKKGVWYTEIAIPLDKIQLGESGDFYALFGRGNSEQNEISASSPIGNSFHDWQVVRRCILESAPLALELPQIIAGYSRCFNQDIVLKNYGSAVIAGELYTCRSPKMAVKIADVAFRPGENDFNWNFPYSNHSLPFWLELRRDGSVVWKSVAYKYAGRSIAGIMAQLPKLHAATGHPYFEKLHGELAAAADPLTVYAKNEKMLKRFLVAVNNQKTEFLKQNFFGYTASSMAKNASGAILDEEQLLPQEIVLDAARGETVNFQVRILPLDTEVKGLTVKSFSVSGVPAENHSAYRILDLNLPGDGIFPDPLSKKLIVDLKPEDNSVSYFGSVTVPETLKAGMYEGRFTVADSEGHEITYPITLKVRSFALPEKPDMFVIVSYEGKSSAKKGFFPGKDEARINDEMRRMISSYGFMPFKGTSHPDWLDEEHMELFPDWQKLEKQFQFIHTGSMPWFYGWLKGFYEYNSKRKFQSAADYMYHLFEEYIGNAAKIREQLGSLNNAFAYYDELETPWQLTQMKMKPDNSELMALLTELKRKSGLKLFTCFCFPDHGDDVSGAEKLVDYFIFNSNYFPGERPRCDIHGLKSRGKRVGWYWNVDKSPISFNMVNYPHNVGLRLHFYKMYQLGLESTLLWGFFGTFDGMSYATTPWSSTRVGGVDGMLVYKENNGFIPSLRLELLRESYNDGRCLTLAERLAKANPGHPAAKRIFEMLKLEWSGNPREADISDRELLQFRSRLADQIEELTR